MKTTWSHVTHEVMWCYVVLGIVLRSVKPLEVSSLSCSFQSDKTDKCKSTTKFMWNNNGCKIYNMLRLSWALVVLFSASSSAGLMSPRVTESSAWEGGIFWCFILIVNSKCTDKNCRMRKGGGMTCSKKQLRETLESCNTCRLWAHGCDDAVCFRCWWYSENNFWLLWGT